ncbi:hypothetical protein MMC07_000652 [Pseudocyphellaria aurata]|nr:hypothetical protein [Pseudocyphellaria aurata]
MEEEICDEADKQLREIMLHLDNLKRELDPALPKVQQILLVDRIKEAEEWRDENRTELALSLADFRKSQGVWGDG